MEIAENEVIADVLNALILRERVTPKKIAFLYMTSLIRQPLYSNTRG